MRCDDDAPTTHKKPPPLPIRRPLTPERFVRFASNIDQRRISLNLSLDIRHSIVIDIHQDLCVGAAASPSACVAYVQTFTHVSRPPLTSGKSMSFAKSSLFVKG